MAAQGMQQRQSLALQQVLSPQLQQSLLILQTPLLELRNLVQQEMETNPVLEELPEDPADDDRGEVEASADENFKDDFERILGLIQTFYPAGVGAHDLRECLLIQLRRQGKEHSLEYRIASEHMDDLGRHRFLEIARRMAISVEDVQKAADNIARLNPRPGQVFAAAPQNYVLPDVIVEKVDGEYQIAFNNEQIPHLRISNLY